MSAPEGLDPDRIRAFLADLSEVSRRHRLALGGCGCCESPYLVKLDDADLAGSYQPYSIESPGDEINWVTTTEGTEGGGV